MSYLNQPCAKLVLKMYDLPALNTSTTVPTVNSAGTAMNLRQQCTWSNINMREVIGSMYDEYDAFNLVCTSITSDLGSSAVGLTGDDRVCTAYMSGLNFRNQCYDTGTKSMTNRVAIGNIFFTAAAGTTVNGTISPSPCTFSKCGSDQTVNLTITLLRNFDGAAAIQGTADFKFIFCFSIFGIKEARRSQTSNNFL